MRRKDTEFSDMNKEKEKKIAEISARVGLIIEKCGLTSNGFAIKLGYTRSQTIYDIINKKSAPSFDFFNRFMISEFSEIINIDWLLTGRGDMRKTKRTMEGVSVDGEHSTEGSDSKDKQNNPNCQENNDIISRLLNTIREQAEEIGQLKALVAELERQLQHSSTADNQNKAAAG